MLRELGFQEEVHMLRFLACSTPLAVLMSVAAFAADPHAPGATGQPTCSCQQTPSTPGNAGAAPGSAFNTGGVAGTKYAGTQPQNSNNPKSVSQYDVACFQQSQH
jgi:hypothetical protein